MSDTHTPIGPPKSIVAVLVSVGIFIALLDTTIVDIVLPHMMASLDSDIYGVQWVVIIYFLGSAISMTAVGWLGEKLGHRNTFLFGTGLFISSSAMAGAAVSLPIMLVARLFQGMGEGIMIPIGLVILYEAFPPEEHGLAMGIYGLSASFAPALGPTLGGLITEHLEWRWVFYINLPIGILTIFLVWLLFKNPRNRENTSFDFIGFALLATAFSALIIFTGKGQEKGWLHSDFIFTMLLIFIVSSLGAIFWLAFSRHPLFPRRILGARPFRLGLLTMFLFSIAAYGFFLLLPVFLQRVHGYTTLQAGLILLPGALLSGFSTAVTGLLSDRLNPKWITFFFLLATAASCWIFHTDMDTPRNLLTLDYVFFGLAVGGVFPPITVLTLNCLDERDIGDGSTLLNVTRLVAGSLGSAYATTIMTSKTHAYFEALSNTLTAGSASLAELLGAMGQLQLGREYFNPDTWHIFTASTSGLMLRRATSYAYHTTYIHMALFCIAAAGVVLLLRTRRKTRSA